MAGETHGSPEPKPATESAAEPTVAEEAAVPPRQGEEGAVEPLRNTGTDPELIVCALDSSNGAIRVLSMGARLARAFPAARLHVIHVFRTSRFDRAHAAAPAIQPDAVADAKDHLEFHVTSARAQCRNEVIGHFEVGDPTAEVLRLVNELKADVLVVGTHDRVGFERLLLGSTAETLVRKAACSVFVVRPAGRH